MESKLISKKVILEIIIPTYNRPTLLKQNLKSIITAVNNLKREERLGIGLTIRNNSTKDYLLYNEVIKDLESFFNSNIGFFDYIITGFNIGSVSNCSGGLFTSKGEYVWFLPDDDLVRFDALNTIYHVTSTVKPALIIGGYGIKSYTSYNSPEVINDFGEANKIHSIVNGSKKKKLFLSGNVVEAQEYIYNSEMLSKFIDQSDNISLLNDMFPGVLAVYVLKYNSPMVLLERSLGIFRDGDPNSGWRHLWYKFALLDWPTLVIKLKQRGWLNEDEARYSKLIYKDILKQIAHRPDILLGLNIKHRLNPYLLLKFYKMEYVLIVLLSPFSMITRLYTKFF